MSDITFDPYDGLSYTSYPYYHSHPDHLFTIAKMFDVSAVNPAKQNISVLEIGCASGNNLIPIALRYPEARLVGIDFSISQIIQAQKQAVELNIKNISFENISISNTKNRDEKIDYIIAHNIISWVDDTTISEVFDLVANLLKPQGVALFSYNVKSGCSAASTLRDMVLYNAQWVEGNQNKIQQAQSFLTFIINTLENDNTPFAQILRAEAQALIANKNMLCDYFISEYRTYNFHEFNQELEKRDLQYLSDSYLPSMYIGNAPPNITKALEQVNDIVDLEEYMDFFIQKHFKASLVCHKSISLKRDMSNYDSSEFYICSNITPEISSKEIVNFDDINQTLNFFVSSRNDLNIQTNSAVMKASFYSIAESASINHVKLPQIIDMASEKLPNIPREDIQKEFMSEFMGLIFSGYINITNFSPDAATALSSKPIIYRLARYQALQNDDLWVTNLRGQIVQIGLFEKYVFRYMDGSYNLDAIAEFMFNHTKQGDLSFSKDKEIITDTDQIKEEIALHLQDTLNFTLQMCLLVFIE